MNIEVEKTHAVIGAGIYECLRNYIPDYAYSFHVPYSDVKVLIPPYLLSFLDAGLKPTKPFIFPFRLIDAQVDCGYENKIVIYHSMVCMNQASFRLEISLPDLICTKIKN